MSELLQLMIRSKPKISDNTDDSDSSPIDTPKTDDSIEVGMQCGYKELWSSEEDEYGKFTWYVNNEDWRMVIRGDAEC